MYIHVNEIMFRYFVSINIINDRSVLESAKHFKVNVKDERRNILRGVCPYVSRNNLRRSESRVIWA